MRTFAGLSKRDASVLAATLHKLDGCKPDFELAVRALNESVMELIPSGRIFMLGVTMRGPILGSIISGVGIVSGDAGVELVRVDRSGQVIALGSLWR